MNESRFKKLSLSALDEVLAVTRSQSDLTNPMIENGSKFQDHLFSLDTLKVTPALSKLTMTSSSSTSPLTPVKSTDNGHINSADVVAKTVTDLEQATTAAIALEHYLEKRGDLKTPEMKENVEQVLSFCTQLSQTLPEISAGNSSFLQDIRKVIAMLQAKWKAVTLPKVVFQMVTDVIRYVLNADRVMIVQVGVGNEGSVVMESLVDGWTPTMSATLPLSYLGVSDGTTALQEAIAPNSGEIIARISLQSNLSPYQHQLFEKYQVKSSISYGIVLGDRLWGFVTVQSCQQERQWDAVELEWLRQLSRELVIKLQPMELDDQTQRQLAQANTINGLMKLILKESSVNRIYDITVREVRRYLDADRVAIFQFDPNSGYDDGEFIAEDVSPGIPSAIAAKVHDHCFGNQYADKYRDGAIQAVSDIHNANLSDCHISILEQFDIQANLIVPLLAGSELWGLLCVHQCRGVRHWSEEEIQFVKQVASLFSIVHQQAEYVDALQTKAACEKAIRRIVDQTRRILTTEEIFATSTQELRQQLKCDRTSIYRFEPDWSGVFVAESVGLSWKPLVGPGITTVWPDTYLQETQGGRYKNGENLITPDIYKAGHYDCHVEILAQFQVRAYMTAPIFQGSNLWGILAAYQNDGPRSWTKVEEEVLTQVANQMGLMLQQAEYVEQAQSQSQQLAKLASDGESGLRLINRLGGRIVDLARVGTSLDVVLELACRELRQELKVDRVGIFQFNDDWSGQFISEDYQGNWTSLVENQDDLVVNDTHLQDTQGGRYRQGQTFRVDDIYAVGHADCHIALLEQFEAKAYMIAPIFVDSQLWGLLGVYQNTGPRQWQDLEEVLSAQVAAQVGFALEQTEIADALKRAVKRERMVRAVVDQIRQLSTLEDISSVVSSELRQYLECDRVGVYRFNSDWSGEFIAESVGAGWDSVLELQSRIPKLRDNINNCTVKRLGRVSQEDSDTLVGASSSDDNDLFGSAFPADTYLQQTQGGRYSRGELYRVTSDIYAEGFPHCYLDVLEQYQARAYIIVAIYLGDYLWGLLAVYQNGKPREWSQMEIDLVMQVSQQLSLAMQQNSYVNQLRDTSTQLQTLATREKENREQIQGQIIQMLSAVRPALDGDLTVRVPVTEDVVGTVASAYNNTIDALRQLVTQVKQAASQVQTTSRTSESAIDQLSEQSQKELNDIQRVLNTIQSMVDASRLVSGSTQQMEQAVSQANQTVQEGDRAMNRTVESILSIRETVSATTKKIKRLGESSQKISKVVSLINNFTTQTNLLALNAAIEATRAGEYGQGFAVVADEVRSLSQQSAEATAEIEALVSEIQEETGAVSQAMDEGIQQVVQGTNLVSETRQSLNAIVQATSQISQLVQGINQAAQTQTEQSDSAIRDMDDLSATAQQTFGKAEEMAIAFQTLLVTSETLQASIDQFKVE
ncbi:MAG: GAF domain-containing protein [Cyanothece sp. SIO2G6]|nr:GAF domain-containing protein [Cyanothece sp. SIO2G6]